MGETLKAIFVFLVIFNSIGLLFVMLQEKGSAVNSYVERSQQFVRQIFWNNQGNDTKEENSTHKFHLPDNSIPPEQNSPIRLLCLILTQPSNLEQQAQAVYDTWGKRCTHLFFLSTKTSMNERGLPILHNPVKEKYENLWSKTKYGFTFAYEHMLNQVDWVFKGDDDTYVIMENMHKLLAAHDPKNPVFFGAHFGKFAKYGYMSGGSGYVLSKAAVEKVVPVFENASYCRTEDDGVEDVEMGKCLSNLGIQPMDSRDPENLEETFLPLHVWDLMTVKKSDWFYEWKLASEPVKLGYQCCSKDVISFHYIRPEAMYELEYLLYKVKIQDIRTPSSVLVQKVEKENQLLSTEHSQEEPQKNNTE